MANFKIIMRKLNLPLEKIKQLYLVQKIVPNKIAELFNCSGSSIINFLKYNHITGKVRGFLCHHCNLILSEVMDIKMLKRVIKYLNNE